MPCFLRVYASRGRSSGNRLRSNLDPAVQQDLLDYLRPLPVEEPQALASRGSQGATVAGCSNSVSLPVGPSGSVELPCVHHTARSSIIYTTGVGDDAVQPDDNLDSDLKTAAQGGGNGVPDFIDRVGASLEDAYDTYVNLGYQPPNGSDKVIVYVADQGGAALPVGNALRVDNRVTPVYLVRHELFHLFQYEYIGLAQPIASHVVGAGTSTGWWMEATAEWAAHKAEAETQNADLAATDTGLYQRLLPNFLTKPHRGVSAFDPPSPSLLGQPSPTEPQYGAFIFAEYLEERHGRDIIRQS